MQYRKLIVTTYYIKNIRKKIPDDMYITALDIIQLLLLKYAVFHQCDYKYVYDNDKIFIRANREVESCYNGLIDRSKEIFATAQIIDERHNDLQLDREWLEVFDELSPEEKNSLYYEMVLTNNVNGHGSLREREAVRYELLYGTLGNQMLIDVLFACLLYLVNIYVDKGEKAAKVLVSIMKKEYTRLEMVYKESGRFWADIDRIENDWHECLKEKGDECVSIESAQCNHRIEKIRDARIKNLEAMLKGVFSDNNFGEKLAKKVIYHIKRIMLVITGETNSLIKEQELQEATNLNGYFKKLDELLDELEKESNISVEWRDRYIREVFNLRHAFRKE